MDLIMTQTRIGSPNGHTLERFHKHRVYLAVPHSMACQFVNRGWARRATPEEIEAEGGFSLMMERTERFDGKRYLKGMVYHGFGPARARHFVIEGLAHQATDEEIIAQSEWAWGKAG